MKYLIILLVFYATRASCQGFYKVIGSRALRPNSEYHLAVSIQSTNEPTTITATLQGTSYNGTLFTAEDRTTVQPFSSRICRFEVGDIEAGDYKIIVYGRGGLEFTSYFPLEYVKKSYSVFIQTDRTVYKPSTKIKFRALILNSQLKPTNELKSESIFVYITDGQGNRIKEWKNIKAIKGVFTEEIQIAKNPVLGNWNITVIVHGQIFHKTIKIAEYILPKFIVDINAPKHVTFKENIINIDIKTEYNYGKSVKGEATVTVYPTINSGVIQPIFQNPIRKVLKINGTIGVSFDIANELKLSDEYERAVIIDVTIEEALTGRRQNNSVEIHLHKYNYKMDLIKTSDYFKPGLKYTAYIKITQHDGTPPTLRDDDDNEVTIRYGYSRVDEVYVIEKHKLNKNGLIKLELNTPFDVTNTTALRIEAEYKDLKERISPIPAAVSFSNTFLQASLLTERPIINLDVEIMINCTKPMKYLEYVLMGRGDILIANTLQVFDKKEFTFHFTATHAMVPIAHLIVSYINSEGELIGDALDIEIDGLLQNFIDIQVNTMETEPDLNVELTVRAQPNSYIGILAIDENVLNLGNNFDLSHNAISNDLKMYDLAMQSPFTPVLRDSKHHFFWQPGSSNAHTAIYDSGADLLTNSHINRHKPTLEDIYLRPIFYETSTVKPDRGFGLPLHSVTRPPLAGPYAFSRIPKPVWNKPKVYLSNDLAETWLFTNYSLGYDGKLTIHRKVPKTLTNWIISGFSLDPIYGLGFVTTPKKIKVNKNFIISLDLPYSIQRGEILAVPVFVYNYMDRDIRAEVTIHNPENLFEFAEITNSLNYTRKIELYRRKKINVKKNSGSTVSFMIMPLKLGNIEIKVTASSPHSQDVAIKNLLVKPEGETEYYTKTLLIDLRKTEKFMGHLNWTIPKNVVEGSQKIEVSAVGDLLGPTIINLKHLIRLPIDCGEQNLINLMSNLLILNHLKFTGQSSPTIENEAIKYLELSYQQQLNYRRSNGSFSAFGIRDSESSIWITAYTVLALNRAQQWIYIDENILETSLDWLVQKQSKNGSFYETGSIIHQNLQNRDGNSLALTAYVVMALIDNQKYKYKLINTINKGLDYLARNIDETESTYTISLCSYVLNLAKHTSKQSAINLLDSRSKSNNNNKKWWTNQNIPNNEMKNPWNHLPKSIDIETTSYGLLSFLENGLLDDSLPIINWLLDQQNNIGGFTTSQDTVTGLYAIYKLINKLTTTSNMQINFSYKKEEFNKFTINNNNAIILQKMEINNKDIRNVNVTAEGKGLALFRVSFNYNMNVTGPWPLFTLDPQVDKNSNEYHLQISICTSFVSRNLSGVPESNMAIMEVNLPSGFTVDVDSLPSLEVSQNVQKVQTTNSLSNIILYFNNITYKEEYCPTISAYRTHKVAKQKPVSVIIYDYYDSSRRARQFYKGKTLTLCDICENEDCGDVCTSQPGFLATDNDKNSKGKGAILQNNWILVILLFIFRTNMF